MKESNDARLLEELQGLMAEELEAFLRYFQLRYRLRDADAKSEAFFDEVLAETREHAEAVASHIRALGGTPKLNVNLETAGGTVTFKEALSEALLFEQQALDAYKDMLPRTKGRPDLENFIRKQVAVEGEHVQEISKLLK